LYTFARFDLTSGRNGRQIVAHTASLDRFFVGNPLRTNKKIQCSLIEADLDFSADVTGFTIPEIDLIVHGDAALDILVPALPPALSVVSRPGDVWMLGHHAIVCGDCREPSSIVRVLNGEDVALVLTDPPYNVKIGGHVSGLGGNTTPRVAMASGEMTAAEFQAFLKQCVAGVSSLAKPGALLHLFMDWRHLGELQASTAALGLEPVNLCVWVKSNGGMGSFYRSQHELVSIVKVPGAPHINNVELGKHGRYRANVWNYAGMNAFGVGRDESLTWHPTVKPVGMIRDAILDASNS
jgi:DNA modification methylase